ncbi:MAG: hypothetical protein HYY20_03550 [Candidatus Tectomicrobia bacterium]|uniref:Type 4a pilus biogenesis protein PilO n=1 Tax=Tectimicrobiota bacterium TaxID=2528274 RepID=A0A932CMN1_UNCTE|nr:hypothetical protein [Candidatus Tectomicrobia bacterium]
MKLSGRQPLALVVITALLGIGLYLLVIHYPSQKKAIGRFKRQEVSLNLELAQAQRELEVQRQALSELVARTPAVHYATSRDRTKAHTLPILEKIARAANLCQVEILSLGPGVPKKLGEFTEHAIPVKFSGEYGRLLQLVKGLEQTLGLRLLQVFLRSAGTNQQAQQQVELSFTFYAYEMQEDPALVLPAVIPGKFDLISLPFSGALGNGGRDPFQAVSTQPVLQAGPIVSPESTRANPIAEPVYQLSGILNFGRRLKAIVNDRLVNEGDPVQDGRVIAIARDGVTLLCLGKPLKIQFKPLLLDGNHHREVKKAYR